MHHPLAVRPNARKAHAVQNRVKVILRAKNLLQQRLDFAVILAQQGKPRLRVGALFRCRRQLGIVLLQRFARRKKAVVEVRVRRVEPQHTPPVDAEFLHASVNFLVAGSKLPLVLTPV